MENGRVNNVEFDQPVIDEVMDLLALVEAKLPFLIRLSGRDKAGLVKPHPGTDQVVATVRAIQSDAGLAPPAPDPMVSDAAVYRGLTAIADRVEQLLEGVEDTRLQAGSEAWNEALIRYGMLRQLQRAKPELTASLDRIQPLITSRPLTPSTSGDDATPAPPAA